MLRGGRRGRRGRRWEAAAEGRHHGLTFKQCSPSWANSVLPEVFTRVNSGPQQLFKRALTAGPTQQLFKRALTAGTLDTTPFLTAVLTAVLCIDTLFCARESSNTRGCPDFHPRFPPKQSTKGGPPHTAMPRTVQSDYSDNAFDAIAAASSFGGLRRAEPSPDPFAPPTLTCGRQAHHARQHQAHQVRLLLPQIPRISHTIVMTDALNIHDGILKLKKRALMRGAA